MINTEAFPIMNLDGIQNLKSISGELFISLGDFNTPTNMEGLSNLEYIGSDFDIQGSDNIENISNIFLNLQTINGKLMIHGNENLLEINDFNNLINCKDITISGKEITNIEGFNSIENINGKLSISFLNNTNSNELSINGFQNLKKIDGSLVISDIFSDFVYISAFNNLEEIGDNMFLGYVSDNLNSFQSLQSVSSLADFNIRNLQNFLPLETLNFVGETLSVESSNSETLWGLESIAHFNGLEITENHNLNFCALPNVCTYLQNGGEATFSNNAPGCNSVEEVLAQCELSIDSHELDSKINIYPNPVKDNLYFEIKDKNFTINKISLYDLSGKLIKEFQNQSKLNLSFYPNGNYVIVLDTDKGFISKKITIAK